MRRRLGPRLARAGLAVAGGSVLAFLVVPVLTVIPMSLSSSMVFELIPTTPGFTQYQRFFASPEWMLALGDRKSTRLNPVTPISRMPSSA